MDSVTSHHIKLLLLTSCLTGYALNATLARATSSDMPPAAPEAYQYTSTPGIQLNNRAKETTFMAFGSIRNQGTELVTVPAGTFMCYHMEVRIGVAFLKATITYWLTKSPPHFLVKHIGKKGPFTKTYTTVLDSIGPIMGR